MDQQSEILATLLRLERKIDGHISHCKCQCSTDIATIQHLPRATKTPAINQCIDLLYSNVVSTLPGVITKLNSTSSPVKQEACSASQQAKPATKAFSAVPPSANQVAPAPKAVITSAKPEARNVPTKKVTSTSDVNNNAELKNITVRRSGRTLVKRNTNMANTNTNVKQTVAVKNDNKLKRTTSLLESEKDVSRATPNLQRRMSVNVTPVKENQSPILDDIPTPEILPFASRRNMWERRSIGPNFKLRT